MGETMEYSLQARRAYEGSKLSDPPCEPVDWKVMVPGDDHIKTVRAKSWYEARAIAWTLYGENIQMLPML
jgi:hypothetical protein